MAKKSLGLVAGTVPARPMKFSVALVPDLYGQPGLGPLSGLGNRQRPGGRAVARRLSRRGHDRPGGTDSPPGCNSRGRCRSRTAGVRSLQAHEGVALAVDVTDLVVERQRAIVVVAGCINPAQIEGTVTQPADAVGLSVTVTGLPVQLECLAVVFACLRRLGVLVRAVAEPLQGVCRPGMSPVCRYSASA